MSASLPFAHTSTLTQGILQGGLPVSAVLVLDQENLIGPDLRWPLRIAKLENADITLLVCVAEKNVKNMKNVDLTGTVDQPEWAGVIADRMREVLDAYLGEGKWSGGLAAEEKTTTDSRPDTRERLTKIQLGYRDPDCLADDIGSLTPHAGRDLVLFVGSGDAVGRQEWMDVLKSTLRSAACSMGLVIPGKRREDGELLVSAGRGPHGRNAINLATALGTETGRGLTSLYVEPDIGDDSPDVGKRILDGLLKGTLADKPSANVKRQVVIHDDPAKGIQQAAREASAEVIVFGATRLGALGEIQSTSIPSKVLRSHPDATLVAVRNTVPLRNRLQRWLQSLVQRYVPQMVREERTDLLERIQSQAQWNFDFRLLIGLSTLIASPGAS